MKKMVSKILSGILIVGVGVFAFTACKDSSQKASPETSGVQTPAETSEVEKTAETPEVKKTAEISGVKVGDHTWSDKNLSVDAFQNGDAIPEAKTADDWQKALDDETPAWCFYDFDEANGEKYGKLYNWFAASDSKGLAPKGWHIPKTTEYLNFTKAQGGYDKKDEMTENMKTAGAWGDQPASNSNGFSALPGGFYSVEGSFDGEGVETRWWGLTDKGDEDDLGGPFTYRIDEDNGLGPNWNPSHSTTGAYLRLVKD